MNALRSPYFFRPVSRPASPAPPAGAVDARSMSKLSFSVFMRASPSPYSVPGPATPLPLVQDGSYLEALSLKLAEAVSRTLAQPSGPAMANELLAGRRPIPTGRGLALSILIASELKATQNNPHLYRAILRTMQRPLSVLITNLSAYLLPILASPVFRSLPSVQFPNPNGTQLHALAIANFAGELLPVFDEFGLGKDNDARGGDGLRPVREGLISIINKVVSPLIEDIRNEIMPLVEALEIPNDDAQVKSVVTAKATLVHHPSIVSLRNIIPVYTQSLIRYTMSNVSHANLATLLLSVVWKGLVALAHRPHTIVTLPHSPVDGMKKRLSPAPTPASTPPLGRFTIKLPPRSATPPTAASVASPADDAQLLFDIFSQLPRPSGDSVTASLAKEAVDEAFNGLNALATQMPIFDSATFVSAGDVEDVARRLASLTQDLPTLISLPILLRVYGPPELSKVDGLLRISDSEYRKVCLSGFARAEECATVIAQRALNELRTHAHPSNILIRWLEIEMDIN